MNYHTLAAALQDATASMQTAGAGGSDYLRLLREFPLMPMTDPEHLTAALAMLDRLYAKEHLSDEERVYRRVLATLVADYERRRPALPPVRGVELLRHLIEENGLRQADLVPLFGAPSIVSEVLAGKRRLSLRHIGRLSERFRLPADVFMDAEPPVDQEGSG
jgi:HTH-type transcriptional regulator/antitoxin HigA